MVYGILIHNEQPTGPALVFIQWTNVCFSSLFSQDFNGVATSLSE